MCDSKDCECGEGHECSCGDDDHGRVGDIFVDQFEEWEQHSGKFNDNRSELYRYFYFEIDPKHAGGYIWRCRTCLYNDNHSVGPATETIEKWFDCKKSYVTVMVKCVRCGTKWRLHIDLDGQKRFVQDQGRMN